MDHPLQRLEWGEPNCQETERHPEDSTDASCTGFGAVYQGPGSPGGEEQLPRRVPCLQVALQGHSHPAEKWTTRQ